MARYEPKRYNRTLLEPEGEHEPRRLRRGRQAPRRLTSSHRRPPVARLLLLAAVLVTVAMLGRTTARYVTGWSNNSLVTAGDFCFESRELYVAGGEGVAFIDESGQNAVFTFTLRNYVVATRPAQHDIQYKCSVTAGGTDVGNVTWTSRDRAEHPEEETLAGKRAEEKEITCQIPLAAFNNGSEVVLTAETTAPYKKVLTAKVVLPGTTGEVVLFVTDPAAYNFYSTDKNYSAVSVSLYNPSGQPQTVTLDWPGKGETDATKKELVPDPTWKTEMDENGRVTVPGGGVVTVVFLKRNTTVKYQAGENYSVVRIAETPAGPVEPNPVEP